MKKLKDLLKEIKRPRQEDMTGKFCQKCHKGKYEETSINDDRDGILHCTVCNDEIERWYPKYDMQKVRSSTVSSRSGDHKEHLTLNDMLGHMAMKGIIDRETYGKLLDQTDKAIKEAEHRGPK